MGDDMRVDMPGNPTIVTDEPVLVFGGCYSNLQATEALLAEARRLGVPSDRMICTGDIIAYGANPRETLALIRRSGIATVMGNCEESLAEDAGDCGCGFIPGSACDRLSAAWFSYATQHVDQADRMWMAALPQRVDLVLAGHRIAVVHGAPSRLNRFVFASTSGPAISAELALTDAEGVIGGHCGIPFTRRVNRQWWHNTGAIGMPANDGTPRGWFSLLTPRTDGIEIRHLPLAYDHHEASRAMRVAGLPTDYADTMKTGIWPSFDILPASEQAQTGRPLVLETHVWTHDAPLPPPTRALGFTNTLRTASGEPYANVALDQLNTLWFNTGTLCNIACTGCYIESTPRNDRLIYLARPDFDRFMDEAAATHPELQEIGFTGGEPFMNPDAPGMIEAALERGFRVLVLTNAMRPMQRHLPLLERLHATYGTRLALRISLDHHTVEGHEKIRGIGSFAPAMAGLSWLGSKGFALAVAARFGDEETEAAFRDGFAALFRQQGITLDTTDPERLVLFPELADQELPPEVTETCWQALRSRGRALMCQSSRMVVHRKGEAAPRVAACTLLPYATAFDLGTTLADAAGPVTLSHPYCSRFCVFGAASCSSH